MTTGGSAENAELVLQTDDVHVADIQEVGGAQIGRQVLLFNLKANYFRVIVATFDVVHRHAETLALRMRGCNGRKQVGSECSDAAFARQMVADESDFANFIGLLHEMFRWLASRSAGDQSEAEAVK